MSKVLFALSAVLSITACHAETPTQSARDVLGTWQISKVNTTGVVTEGDERINALLGKTLTITETQVVEADEAPCQIVKPYPLARVVDTTQEVPLKAAPSPAAAGLPDKALMVDTGCLTVFRVGDTVIFNDRGAYYTAKRVQQ